ncbi:hypothetical protein SDC9_203533 [bioreactor metagenome]|uniref:Uncharacterized protein n=1 Tax=bioreactor metagenome TaxID=1076179 RepID=A0A645IZG0_9ZZZZ
MEELIAGFMAEERFGFEETAYLLLFGALPTRDQLRMFDQVLGEYRPLPAGFRVGQQRAGGAMPELPPLFGAVIAIAEEHLRKRFLQNPEPG